MPDCKSFVSTFWLAFSLTLMAPALVAPIRTSGFISVSPRTNRFIHAFVLPLDQTTITLSAAMATDAVLEVDALPSESEEQDRADGLEQPRVSFLIPWFFRKVPDRQLIAPRSILSLYHLRC